MNLYLTYSFSLKDDKPKGEAISRAKRRIEEGRNELEEKKARSSLHFLNTSDKINYASLTVQRRRMDVEVKQTKLLSFAT